LFVVYLTTLFSNLDYTASNERAKSEWRVGKSLDGNGHVLKLRHYPRIRPEGQRKTTKNISQEIRYSGQDLNPGHPEYEAGV
jgi:hypothetical protein